jgi:nucleoside-diphosphate-sugar epimerase
MSVLVTGGSGFIGSHLVESLLDEGRRVKVLALKKPIEPIEEENLKVIKKKGAEIAYGDLRDKESLMPAVKGVDVVFHLAAISRPMRIPTRMYYEVNRDGTKNLLEAAHRADVQKFVHTSTVSVLGGSPDGHPLTAEEYQPTVQHYGLSKKEGEHLTLRYFWQRGLPVTVIRPCLTYGPRCLVRLIMFKYVQRGLFPLFNHGEAKMEFCYVDNLVQAIRSAEKTNSARGEVFNVTDGRSYKIREVLTTIAEELGVRPPFVNLPIWAGKLAGLGMEGISKILGTHPPFSRTATDWMSRSEIVYDCGKAKKMLGYDPKVSLRKGVRQTIEWYREKGYLK